MIRISATIAALSIAAFAANADAPMTKSEVADAARSGIEFVDNEYIRQRQAENADLMLIDVRTKQEFDLARIPGATWIPRGMAEFEIAETVRDADTEIIVYCRTGSRAALVKKSLDAQGYRNVTAHAGFENWSEARLPVVNDLGMFVLVDDEK